MILKRTWVPLVVVMVVALGATTVTRLRGVFGSEAVFSAVASQAAPLPQINVKRVRYEVLGPGNTGGSVSYTNQDSQPEQATFSTLPWTFTIETTLSSVIASVVAQGNSDSIGCRITVDGEVRDEQHASAHHTQTSCLVKAA